MNQNTLKAVNWRAAIMLPQNPQPLHCRAIEVSEKTVVLQVPIELKNIGEFRVYLDVPDPLSGAPVYLDFKVKVNAITLMGQISQFRHIMNITEIKPQQKEFLLKLLNR